MQKTVASEILWILLQDLSIILVYVEEWL